MEGQRLSAPSWSEHTTTVEKTLCFGLDEGEAGPPRCSRLVSSSAAISTNSVLESPRHLPGTRAGDESDVQEPFLVH
jgi:hypothetical protein